MPIPNVVLLAAAIEFLDSLGAENVECSINNAAAGLRLVFDEPTIRGVDIAMALAAPRFDRFVETHRYSGYFVAASRGGIPNGGGVGVSELLAPAAIVADLCREQLRQEEEYYAMRNRLAGA